jgi:hypothetical protein
VLVVTMAVLVGTVAVAVITLGAMYVDQLMTKPAAPEPVHPWPWCAPGVHSQDGATCIEKPTPSSAASPPTPATVTVTAEPSPAPSTVAAAPTDRDAQFVALVAPKLPPKYNQGLPDVAHEVCADLAGGQLAGQVIETFKNKHPDDPALTWDGLQFFVTNAVQTYCPQYANRPTRFSDGD